MPSVEPMALPMREALAYWQDKVPVPRAEFDELAEQMRARAFYVSGLSRTDQIAAVQSAIYQALADGTGIDGFKAQIGDIIKQQNWSGVRLEVIFRTNVQSAYMAGRYAQMTRPEIMKARPYWRYSAINDGRTRPAHREMDGKVFPADSPVWETWMPPNGYRCRCGVDTLSVREVERDGLTVETEDPTGKLFEPTDWRTGQKGPARPLMPDTGFMRNVGREWTAGFSPTELDEKLEDFSLPAELARSICRDGRGLFAEGGDCFPPLSGIDRRHSLPTSSGDWMENSLSPPDYALAFLREFGIDDIDGHTMHWLPGNIPVPIDKGFFIDKATGGWKTTWADKGPYVRLLARAIINPYEVMMRPVKIRGGVRMAIRLIRPFAYEKTLVGYVTWSLIGNRWWTSTAFMPNSQKSQAAVFRYVEKQRGGVLLYREELK